MVCSGFCGGVQFWGEDPLVGPLEEGAVGWGCVCIVVLACYVEREVEEGLAAGFDEGGESGIWVSFCLERRGIGYVRHAIGLLDFVQELIQMTCFL